MYKVLVLGATGNTGKGIVKILHQFSNIEIVAAGRNINKLNLLKEKYPRIKVKRIDARSKEDILNGLFNIDLLVVASTTFPHFRVAIDACIEKNCKFIDIHCSYKEKIEYLRSKTIKNLFITDAGLWPGSPLAIYKYLGNSESVYITALFSKPGWQELASIETIEEHNLLYQEYNNKENILIDNVWKSSVEQKNFNFKSIGDFLCDPTYLQEITKIKEYNSNIKNFGIYTKTEPEEVQKNITQINAYKNDKLALEIIHECGWYMTSAATVSCILQALDSDQIGVFLAGEFLNPYKFINSLNKFGIEVNKYNN